MKKAGREQWNSPADKQVSLAQEIKHRSMFCFHFSVWFSALLNFTVSGRLRWRRYARLWNALGGLQVVWESKAHSSGFCFSGKKWTTAEVCFQRSYLTLLHGGRFSSAVGIFSTGAFSYANMRRRDPASHEQTDAGIWIIPGLSEHASPESNTKTYLSDSSWVFMKSIMGKCNRNPQTLKKNTNSNTKSHILGNFWLMLTSWKHIYSRPVVPIPTTVLTWTYYG